MRSFNESDGATVRKLLRLRRDCIHTGEPGVVREKLEQLVSAAGGGGTGFLNPSTVNPIKYLARVHGLPRSFQGMLTEPFRLDPDDSRFLLKVAMILKYSVNQDHDFITLPKLISLLANYPHERVAAKKDFFIREIITQLLLTITIILNPDRIQQDRVEETSLQALQSYLPSVNGKFRSAIKTSLERMGYWSSGSLSSSLTTQESKHGLRGGEEIIRSFHGKKGSKVSAHVVKTQQTQAVTTEENISEKTQMQNINLSNALQQSRARSTAAAQDQATQISEARSARGSDRCWWKSTSWEINNFLIKARGNGVISNEDIDYLRDKFGGYKFSFTQSGWEMVSMIAEIFYLITTYQEISTDTMATLLRQMLDSRRSDGTYDGSRVHILRATERHCLRRQSVPQEIETILSDFNGNSSCTNQMKKIIWCILSKDDKNLEKNFQEALKLLEDPVECLQALDYIEKQVSKEQRCKSVEKFNFIPAILHVVTGKPGEKFVTAPTSAPTMQYVLNHGLPTGLPGLQASTIWDTLIPGRKIYRSITEECTFNFSNVTNLFGYVNPMVFATDAALSYTESFRNWWSRKKGLEEIEKVTASVDRNNYPEAAKVKAMDIVEDYLTFDWTQGLDTNQVVILTDKAIEAGSGELNTKIIRCILRSLDKNQNNPQYFRSLPETILAFLFAVSANSPDKRLQIFTLAIIGNLLNNPDIYPMIADEIRQVDFLRQKLLRKDIIFHSNGQVTLEEELPKDFSFDNADSDTEKDFTCISAIVAKIFVATLDAPSRASKKSEGTDGVLSPTEADICDESTISIATQCLLSSPDKLTRIYCSEYLFKAARSGKTFSPAVLNSIQGCAFDTVADIHVYTTAAYCTALANQREELSLEHLNYLPNLYSFKRLRLGEEDFTPWVNPKILQSLHTASGSVIFPEQVFHLLTYLLNNTCADSVESEGFGIVAMILDILENFTGVLNQAEKLPPVTVDAVENLLLESDVFDENCARIVERCMLVGRWVSDAVLEEFAKYLFYASDTSVPYVRRLCLANDNQELPEAIFENFQMELIGLRLCPEASKAGHSFLVKESLDGGNVRDLLDCLTAYLSRGKLLSSLNMTAMECLLKRNSTFADAVKCLTLAASNGQSLSKALISKSLLKDCGRESLLPLELAVAIVQRNQQLPPDFVQLVFKQLGENEGGQKHQILQLLTTMIQYNQKLPRAVIKNYCLQMLKESQAGKITSDLLSALVRLVDTKIVTTGPEIQACIQIFLSATESSNATFVDIALKGLSLISFEEVKIADRERLARFIQSANPSTRSKLLKLYGSDEDDPLVQLYENPKPSKDQLLSAIKKISETYTETSEGKVQLPATWLDSLETFMSKDHRFVNSIHDVLRSSEKLLTGIEEELLEAASFVLLNTSSGKVKESCKKVIETGVRRNGKLNKTCTRYMMRLEGRKDIAWRQTLSINTELHPVIVELEEWIENPTDEQVLSRVGRHLSDSNICEKHCHEIISLLTKVDKKSWKRIPNIVNVVAFHLIASKDGKCQEWVDLLQDELLRTESSLNLPVLTAYLQMDPSQMKQYEATHIQVLEKLAVFYQSHRKNLAWNEIALIFNTFLSSIREDNLPKIAMDVVEDGLFSGNPAVRGRCFLLIVLLKHEDGKDWKRIKEDYWHKLFKQNLQTVYREIFGEGHREPLEESEYNLELLLTLYFLSQWDLRGLKSKKKEDWFQHLLVSEFVNALAHTFDEQLTLYPIASEFLSKSNPILCRDIIDSLKEYKLKNPNVSIPRLVSTFTWVKTTSHDDFLPITNNWISELIINGLSHRVHTNFSDISRTAASMLIKTTLETLNWEFLHDLLKVVAGKGINFRQFHQFLAFLTENPPVLPTFESHLLQLDGRGDCITPSELLKNVQVKFLLSPVPMSFTLRNHLENHLTALVNRGYSFHDLQELFTAAKNQEASSVTARAAKFEALENVISQLSLYSVSPEFFQTILVSLKECGDVGQWVDRCNARIMEAIFSGSLGVKNVEEIWKEFCTANDDDDDESIDDDSVDGDSTDDDSVDDDSVDGDSTDDDSVDDDSTDDDGSQFIQLVKKVSAGNFSSVLPNLARPIKSWNKDMIVRWSHEFRKLKSNQSSVLKYSPEQLIEAVAVIKQAYVLTKNFHLTPIQILSCAGNVNKEENKGTLMQVATGSGKSTIIAVIAVLRALLGIKVDIYTSSPVLAERDAKEWESFYALFKLTCDHNGDKGSGYIRGEKNCYKKDIVYGDTSQFQFDTLRDEYSGLRTRAGRNYGFAIVDEVDSMFIDDSSKLARLSSTLPGMDLLQLLYHLTWHRLHDVQERLFAIGQRMFYLEGKRGQANGQGRIPYEYAGEEGRLYRIENVAMYILQNLNDATKLENSKIFPVQNIESFVADHLKDYIRVLIGDKTFAGGNSEKSQRLDLPKPLVRFARTQINNWVESAMTAVTFQENVHYIVDEGQIKPVDFLTTGIIQSSTNWNNGLHQFLQIKHSLKVTTETVTTNFLSNMAMFQKYGSNLIGFTGTLGSPYGQEVLEKVYNVETVIIPELYYKRFVRLPDVVLKKEDEWLSTIVHAAHHESAKGRGVLIICQTIKLSELISQELTRRCRRVNVKLYVRNGENQEKQVERIHPGDVIVATNLAGRGTDIKTVDVEKYGGLHVILTFLPDSLRVEDQAFGRTARQGNKGTGQLIVRSSEDSENLANIRDSLERAQLEAFLNKELRVIQTKDKLFQRFSKLYLEKREHLRSHPTDSNVIVTKAKSALDFETLTPLDITILQALEERWAIFLKRIDDQELHISDATAAYDKFELELKENFAARRSILSADNAFYWVQYGNEYYRKDSKLNSKAKESVQYFDSAIRVDPQFVPAAYVGKAYVLLKGEVNAVRFNTHSDGYKNKAIELLQQALRLLYTEIGLYTTAQTLLNLRTGRSDSDLFNQLTSKVNLIGDYARNLEGIIHTVQQSLRRVYCTGLSNDTEMKVELEDKSKLNPLKDWAAYNLHFHDLTAREDSGTVDQALNTIEAGQGKLKNITGFLGLSDKCPSDKTYSIALQVDNQDLKKLMTETLVATDVISTLTLQGIRTWDGIQTILDTLEPETFTLGFSGTVSAIDGLLKSSALNQRTFKLAYSDPKAQFPTTYMKKLSAGSLVSQNVPTGLDMVEITVAMSKHENISSLKESVSGTILSLSLSNVTKAMVETHWEKVLQRFSNNTARFSSLNRSSAKSLIQNLRSKNVNFILEFEGLDADGASFFLKKSDRQQEDIEQTELREMNQQFSSEFLPLEELRELAQRGILFMATFTECGFVPWRSVIAMGILASVQVAAGGLLVCTGFGATLGLGLITEGMSDYLVAGRAYSSRSFSWSGYATQKAVSLTISAVSMGLGALKDGAKGAAMAVEGAANETAEQLGTYVIMNGKNLTETVKVSSQNLQSLVVKHIGVKAVETGARAGLNSVVDSVTKFSFDQVKNEICREVDEAVRRNFRAPDFAQELKTFSAVDTTRSPQLPLRIRNWVCEMTNPQSEGWNKVWDTVGWPLCQGILSDSQYLGSTFSMITRVIGMLHGMAEIATVVDSVCGNILEKLRNENKTLTPTFIIHSTFSIELSSAKSIVEMMEFEDVTTFRVKHFPSQEKLGVHMVDLTTLKKLFNGLHEAMKSFKFECESVSRILKSVGDPLTAHIIRTADRQLISPVTTFCVGKFVSELSQEVQSRFLVRDSEMSMDQEKAAELKKKPAEELTEAEREFLSQHDRPITFVDQIQGNAKDHNIAYQQRDTLYQAFLMATDDKEKRKEEGDPKDGGRDQSKQGDPKDDLTGRNKRPLDVSEPVRRALEGIVLGGPGDMSTIFLLATANGQKIKITDDPNYKLSPEEKEAGFHVIVFHKGENGSIGHYSLRDEKTGELKDFGGGDDYDCAYRVLGEITGKSPDELREEAAKLLVRNVEQYEMLQDSAQWIRDRYPQDANNLLGVGGLRRKPEEEEYAIIGSDDQELQEQLQFPLGEETMMDDDDNLEKIEFSEGPLKCIQRSEVNVNGQTVKRIHNLYAEITKEDLDKGTKTGKDARDHISELGGQRTDEAGHILARCLGGLADEYNLFPQNGWQNLRQYTEMEKFIYDKVKDTGLVKFGANLVYDGDTGRPTCINFYYEAKGELVRFASFQNPSLND